MSKHPDYPDTHHDVSSNTIFGFWLYLMTDLILFATLFAAYAVLQNRTFGAPTAKDLFDLPSILGETVVFLTSVLTCSMGLASVARERKMRAIVWYSVTLFVGFYFLVTVGSDLLHLIFQGVSWQQSAFLSSYFTLAVTHWLHIALGLLFMLLFVIQTIRRGLIPVTIRRLTCMSLFWFFSYVVWIFMFTIVYLIGVKG